MQLNHTTEGKVTRLATARAVRGLSHLALGRRIGVDALTIFRWETGKEAIPRISTAKRLGLALRWPWEDLMADPLDNEDATQRVWLARRAE